MLEIISSNPPTRSDTLSWDQSELTTHSPLRISSKIHTASMSTSSPTVTQTQASAKLDRLFRCSVLQDKCQIPKYSANNGHNKPIVLPPWRYLPSAVHSPGRHLPSAVPFPWRHLLLGIPSPWKYSISHQLSCHHGDLSQHSSHLLRDISHQPSCHHEHVTHQLSHYHRDIYHQRFHVVEPFHISCLITSRRLPLGVLSPNSLPIKMLHLRLVWATIWGYSLKLMSLTPKVQLAMG